MNLSYRHILAAAMIAVGGTMTAQTLNSAYFTDEYTFRHTMNPAYGNEDNYVSVPALGNINVKMQGNYGDWAISSSTTLHREARGSRRSCIPTYR